MDLPAEVLIHNQQMGIKGRKGQLLMVDPRGFYEVKCSFGDKVHKVLFPIQETVLIFRAAEQSFDSQFEIER
jgi:hypothetical protein